MRGQVRHVHKQAVVRLLPGHLAVEQSVEAVGSQFARGLSALIDNESSLSVSSSQGPIRRDVFDDSVGESYDKIVSEGFHGIV